MNLARQPHHLCQNAVIGAVRTTRGRPGAGSVTMTMAPTTQSCRSKCPIEHRRGGRVGGTLLDEPCRYRENACSPKSTVVPPCQAIGGLGRLGGRALREHGARGRSPARVLAEVEQDAPVISSRRSRCLECAMCSKERYRKVAVHVGLRVFCIPSAL